MSEFNDNRLTASNDISNSANKALDTGKKAAKAAKKAKDLFGGAKTQKDIFAILKLLLQRPSFWLGSSMSGLVILVIIFCMLLPLSWFNMDDVLTDPQAEAKAYERMINSVLHVYKTAYGGYEDIAENYLDSYLSTFFPKNGAAKLDGTGLDYNLSATSNLTTGGEYVSAGGEEKFAYGVKKEVISSDYPEEITAEEAIAIQYVAVCSVLDQYFLDDAEIDLNDLDILKDTFFGGLEQAVATDQLSNLVNGNVEYGSTVNGEWEAASTIDKSKGILNNMTLLDTNATWVEKIQEDQSTAGTHTRYVTHPKANIWSGSLTISIRLKDHENFMKDRQEKVIAQMVEEGQTEEQAQAQLEKMYSEMADNITEEVMTLHDNGIETNPDGTDPTPDGNAGSSNPIGSSEGAMCFPQIPTDTVYIQYGSGGEQYAALFNTMRSLGFSLYGNKIQCVDMAKYCLYLQRGYAGTYGDGGVFARNLINTHPEDYRSGSIGELCSGSFVSMMTNGYGGYSAYGHVIYIEAVLDNGMVLIDEGLPMYSGHPGEVKIRRLAPISAISSQTGLTIAIPRS